jgi:hypothetical protein
MWPIGMACLGILGVIMVAGVIAVIVAVVRGGQGGGQLPDRGSGRRQMCLFCGGAGGRMQTTVVYDPMLKTQVPRTQRVTCTSCGGIGWVQ